MKLKHYLGALLMAGSVVAISFPADAISQKQAPVKQGISQIIKSLHKNISKSVTGANGIVAGGTIIVSSGTVVHLNPQNANSEKTPIRVSGVRISPAGKSALTLRGKKFVCDSLPLPGYVAVVALQPDFCPTTNLW